jgi:hypothetical protein
MDILGGMSSVLGGMDSFAEAGQLATSAAGMKANAGILDVEARGELAAGKLQGEAYRREADKFIGRQRAMYAKAGVRFTGSPASVWAETERNIQLDMLNISLNATARANAIGFEALQMRIAAGRARTAAVAKAGEGLVKIVGSMAMQSGGSGSTGIKGGGGVTSYTQRGDTTFRNITVK